jgi:putative molybdopterin biosynthesis protein
VFLHIASIPLGIASLDGITLDDLPSVRFINAKKDSPSRLVLDAILKSAKLDTSRINGYRNEAASPMDAVLAIKAGHADATLCRKEVALAAGLHFQPVGQEEYGLAIRTGMIEDSKIVSLKDLVNSSELKERIRKLEGYDTSLTGEIRDLPLSPPSTVKNMG